MSQKQEMETDRLVTIIQTIQLGRKTGVLTARRGEGINVEEGTITFVNGKATETQVGRRKGPEAFNLLCLWGNCMFTFASSNPFDKVIFSSPSQPPAQMSPAREVHTPPPFIAVSPLRVRSIPPSQDEEQGLVRQNLPQASIASIVVLPHLSRQLGSALQMIEKMKLSRLHRQILLLIDGQRSNIELERLTGRSQEEILKILYQLEQATIIQIQR